jgi:large subunit ribosomal protein L13
LSRRFYGPFFPNSPADWEINSIHAEGEMKMKTFLATAADIQRKWFVVDANGKTLGRLATAVASILRGKHKPTFTPNVDCGDHVIIINAEKIVLTGKKAENKVQYRHSMYPGGLKAVKYGDLLKNKPEYALTRTIWGMLPHNRLGRQMIKKLRVYRGNEHPHAAQKPENLEIEA